jgi:hypothetical protein
MNEDFRLDQLLADPLIRMVMASDAVQEADIRRLAARLTQQGVVTSRPAHAAFHLSAPRPALNFAAEPCYS